MQTPDTLIRTKLRQPFIRSELVPRPRLQARITEGLHKPLTLIVAPAGFGKTTSVASSIAGCGMPIAWLSLDKNDNQVGHFLNYLVAAVQDAVPTIGDEAAQLIASQQAPPEAILINLINDLDSADTEIALVLDDYQFINSQAVHKAIAFLLDHCPTTFHLLIATRSDPPLPLARLRARGQMYELRTADLRFTTAEATQFLNENMGLHLDTELIAVLEERTEGWIAGLQMASLAVQARLSRQRQTDVDSLIQAFAGTHRFIMDYLLEEVLTREPDKVQIFLLQTSILTRLTGPLCDAVTGDSGGQEMLEKLEQRNLFVVPLDDERRWYRYHHLFADLLQARLQLSEPGQVAQLLSRAAQWCAQEEQVAEAVSYALAAQNYEQAGDLITRYWQQMLNKGEIETVWSWLNALPENTVRHSAPLSLAYCWVLWLKGQIDTVEAHLRDAEYALSKESEASEVAKDTTAYGAYAQTAAEITTLRSFVARYNNDFEAASALAKRALRLVPDNLPSQTDVQLRSLIFLALASAYDGAGNLNQAVDAYDETIRLSRLGSSIAGVTGITYRWSGILRLLGRLRKAEVVCRDALEYLQAQGMMHLPSAGILHVAMSEILIERNDLEGAKVHLSQGLELRKWGGRLDAVRNAAYALSRLRHTRDDTKGALAAIQEAESMLGYPPSPLAKAELLALKARILARQGDLSEAAHCVKEAVDLAGWDCGLTGELVAFAAFRVLLAQRKLDDAIAKLTHSLDTAAERGRLGVVIELRILRSLAVAEQGDTPEARADLKHALALAEPEGYARVFLDEGQPMQTLLAQWLAHADDSPLRDYAIHLLAQFDVEPHTVTEEDVSPANTLIEPLSERELEVLHLIALGNTNKEIAQQLFIAPGTVKAHTASIYRKLDVANRTEAAARARILGILP